MFCYQVKKWIGAYTAALGGLDTLVFTGGIGEHAATIRARICEGLGYLGIEIHQVHNNQNLPIISGKNSRVKIWVIHTNEELMIARSVFQMIPTRRSEPRETLREDYP
jgi:acetate kinase